MNFTLSALKDRPLGVRGYFIPLYLSACQVTYFLPAGTVRTSVSIPALLYLLAQVPKYTSGNVGMDIMMAINCSLLFLKWVDFNVLHSTETEFWQVEERGPGDDPAVAAGEQKSVVVVGDDKKYVGIKKQKTWPYPNTLWGRFKWLFSLWTTMRGVGWNWRVKGTPVVPASMTKWPYVRKKLLRFCIYYLASDALTFYLHSTPFGTAENIPYLLDQSLLTQVIFGWMCGCQSFYSMQVSYPLFTAIVVGLGLYSPQEMPDFMGSLSDCYTVRKFWGSFWHQNLRRILYIPYEILKRFITIPSGTLQSRYVQLVLAFFMSAFIHHVGALNDPFTPWSLSRWQVLYFSIQPLAIMAEDLAIHVGKRYWGFRETRFTKTIGYLWTFAWFSFSLRYAATYTYGAGLGAVKPMPSLLRWVVGKM